MPRAERKKHVRHNGYIHIKTIHRDRESKPILFDSTLEIISFYSYNKVQHPPSPFLDLDLRTSRTISMKITSTFLLLFAEVS